jgi:hypothetical protein
MKVSGQCYILAALSLQKQPQFPLDSRLFVHFSSLTNLEEKTCLHLSEIELRFLGRSMSSPVSILYYFSHHNLCLYIKKVKLSLYLTN